jgi:hypothetical protein
VKPCQRDPNPDRWIESPRAERMALRLLCLHCPDRVNGECARRALMRDDVRGMWAGVWVSDPSSQRFKLDRETALQRLHAMAVTNLSDPVVTLGTALRRQVTPTNVAR